MLGEAAIEEVSRGVPRVSPHHGERHARSPGHGVPRRAARAAQREADSPAGRRPAVLSPLLRQPAGRAGHAADILRVRAGASRGTAWFWPGEFGGAFGPQREPALLVGSAGRAGTESATELTWPEPRRPSGRS